MSDGSVAESGRTALRVAAVVLLVLVVAPFVVTGMPAVIGAEESFVVLSGSMNAEPEPIIQPGDVVIVDGVNPANIEEQDIITFTTGSEEPVTHRVVNVTGENGQVAFRTKGDANEDADQQLIGPDQVIGEVILVIPLIGHVVNFANTTQGFVLLVLLPIGLLVVSEIWNLLMADDESTEGDSEPERSPPAGAAEPAVESETDEDDDGPSTVSLGRAQMGWITVGFVPISAAAGYLAFRLQTAWILTLFFASVGLTILSGLLYLRIKWGGTATETGITAETARSADREAGDAGGPTGGDAAYTRGAERASSAAPTTVEPIVEDGAHRNPVVTGRIENAIGDGSHVEVSVDSREALVGMAIEKGTWVVHDPDAGTYVLVDDGMLFRYDDTAATGPASSWEEESGWVTFSEGEDATERTNGSNGSGRPDEVAQASKTERAAEPTGTDVEESTDVAGTESGDSATSVATVEGTEIEEVEAVGEASERTRNGDESTTVEDDIEESIPAIRRVDETEKTEPIPAIRWVDEADPEPVDGEGSNEDDRPIPDGSVETDGGTDTYRSGVVGAAARVFRLPVWAFAVVGYLVVEPPATLYRALRSDDDGDEERSESETRTEGES
jgi:signal peptidase